MEKEQQSQVNDFSEYILNEETSLNFIFVVNDDGKLTNILQKGYDILNEFCSRKKRLKIIKDEECLKINHKELDKGSDIFIFEKFEGDSFRHIEQMKDIYALGVKCIIDILQTNSKLNQDNHHYHNLCATDIYISFASIHDREYKRKLEKLTHWMGGFYSSGLSEHTTHLVTEDIFSKKYAFANQKKMKIMSPKWLEDVWDCQQDFDFNLRADSPFFKKHALPIFHKQVFTSTGFSVKENQLFMELIEKNGGEYQPSLKTAVVTFLIMSSKDIESAKHKAAVKYKIRCITQQWIHDSVKAGFAVPLENKYCFQKIRASTPTKDTTALNRFNFDNTMISDISSISEAGSSKISNHITLEETKRSSLSRTSHSISKQLSFEGTKNNTFKKPQPLAMPQNPRISDINIPPPPFPIHNEVSEASEMDTEDSSRSIVECLGGKKFFLHGYEEDEEMLVIFKEVEKYGGTVVDSSYTKIVDYILTPNTFLRCDKPTMKSHQIVNDYWLEDTINECRCVEIRFYHMPIFVNSCDHEILKNETFVLSGFKIESERPYLKSLIKTLGGEYKEQMKKGDDDILVCAATEGRKYKAAIDWKMTIITAEWLCECYRQQKRFDETKFLLGGSKPSKRNVTFQKGKESIIPYSQGSPLEDIENLDEEDFIVRRQKEQTTSPYVMPKRVAELRKSSNKSSPKTPTTPTNIDNDDDDVLSISNLCADMPTPQRELTKAVLREGQAQNQMSPRAQRQKDLMKTPGMAEKYVFGDGSPLPELPDIMRPPPVNYAPFADSSPETQWWWKRKIDAIQDDKRTTLMTQSQRKALKEELTYEQRRYECFIRRLPNFASPEPKMIKDEVNNEGNASLACMTQEAAKFFMINESEAASEVIDRNKFITQSEKEEEESLQNKSKQTPKSAKKEEDFPLHWAASTQEHENFIYPGSKKLRKSELEGVKDFSREFSHEYSSADNDSATPCENESPVEIVEELTENSPEALNSDGDEINFGGKEKLKEFYFNISSTGGEKVKEDLKRKIEELGGEVRDDFNYLLMEKLTKSPKFFNALARGAFVLHIDFIHHSIAQKKFLNPFNYEIGNPNFRTDLNLTKSVAHEIIQGPYICRKSMEKYPEKYENGLFTGINFVIYASPSRKEIFKDIIEAGGGKVVNDNSSITSAILKREKIKYCLIENIKVIPEKDFSIIKECKVEIKNLKFIYDYLLSSKLQE